ncbi:MAG TPA: AAA family ATPase, partial [Bellilinea sp.]|nr:AAA family ATPase [Bellilinea sp.]
MNASIEDIVEDLAKISARLEEAVNREQSKRGTKKNKKARPGARRAILGACFDAALDADQRRLLTRKDKARVVLIKVPTASWIHDVELYFTNRFSATWQTFARDGNRTRQQASTDSVEVAIAIAGGKSVVGIAANVDVLPSTLLASADLVVRIQMPSGKVIEDAILRFKGRRPPAPVENDIVAGLDFFDLVAALNDRRGASRLNDDVPILATAVEYGAARDWGLALAQDIRDYRAGLIGWNAIDRGAVLYSEPGLGKSLFARMLAKECGLPLVISSVAELFAKSAGDLGAVIQAERQVFAEASALAPAILFMDELDGLPSRANMSNRG